MTNFKKTSTLIIYILTACSLTILFSCSLNKKSGQITEGKKGQTTTDKKIKNKVITLEGYLVDCHGPFPQKCFVEVLEDGSKVFLYEGIIDFDFKKGYKQTISVQERKLCDERKPLDCPQDGSLYEYKFLKLIKQEKSSATFKKDFPNGE